MEEEGKVIFIDENADFEQIAKITKLDTARVHSTLTILEISELLHRDSNGKFSVIDPIALAKSQAINKEEKQNTNTEKDNVPAPDATNSQPKKSDENISVNINPVTTNLVPKVYDANPEIANFANKFAGIVPTVSPQTLNDAQRSAAADRITTTTNAREKAIDLGTTATSKKVKFILHAQ